MNVERRLRLMPRLSGDAEKGAGVFGSFALQVVQTHHTKTTPTISG